VTTLRKFLLGCVAAGCVAASAAVADTAAILSASIPPQPLAEALATFGRQSGLQLIYLSTVAESRHSNGARAGLTPVAALAQLLEGTGLTFEFLNPRTLRIFPVPLVPATVGTRPTPQRSPPPTGLALEQVIVTATRREEAVNRVPIDMLIRTADDMQASGVNGMSELAPLTPGLQLQPSDGTSGATTYLLMRGVTGRYASTTGLYLDDAPIPPAWGDFLLLVFPFTFDLERVEVLRGPQLQLFGEGNEGGAVRFISRQPSLSTFNALATSELATTRFGAPSYEAGAAAGGPVIPAILGYRVSAWVRSEGGYVNRVDPFTEAVVERNANHSQNTSLRGALTFAPSEELTITPSLTYTSFSRHDSPYFFTDLSDVGAGQLRNGSLLRQPTDGTFYLGTGKLTAAFGGVQLRALTSYFSRTVNFVADDTSGFFWGSPLGPGYPVTYADAVADRWHFQQRMFAQELRLSSPDPDAKLRWDAAAFYSNYHVWSTEHMTGTLGLPGLAPAPTDLVQEAPGEKMRLAVFGELALRVTEPLTASVGLHGEHARYDTADTLAPTESAAGSDSGLMPRFKLAYQAAEYELAYLTVGKGYGGGGSIPGAFVCDSSPAVYGMDTLWSYEVGTKSTLLDGRMQLDTGLFHIAWSNAGYHLGTAADPAPCGLNAAPGAAASNGFDLAVQALPSARVTLNIEVAYTDARYTRTITQDGVVIVRQGQAINSGFDFVSVSPWHVTASINYQVKLGPDVTGDLRAEDVFRSQNPGPFAVQDPGSPFYVPGYRPDPATNLLNLRATVRWQRCDAALFVNNALNALPITQQTNATGVLSQRLDAATFRPLTVGLTVSWHL
jgi:iron complex outermembrane recepter protein